MRGNTYQNISTLVIYIVASNSACSKFKFIRKIEFQILLKRNNYDVTYRKMSLTRAFSSVTDLLLNLQHIFSNDKHVF